MREKQTKYYIPDEKGKSKQVSSDEYHLWVNENEKKYNKEFKRADGSKEVSLSFVGIKTPEQKQLTLFKVRSVFYSLGEAVTDFTTGYSNYNSALKDYELELLINGDAN